MPFSVHKLSLVSYKVIIQILYLNCAIYVDIGIYYLWCIVDLSWVYITIIYFRSNNMIGGIRIGNSVYTSDHSLHNVAQLVDLYLVKHNQRKFITTRKTWCFKHLVITHQFTGLNPGTTVSMLSKIKYW